MAVRVFLDGLNQLGVSMAYALPKEVFEITAFDQETSLARQLKKEKHVSKVVTMVADGAKAADIIILNQPVDLLSMHYDAIGGRIRPGAVLIDTSPVPLFAGRLAEKFITPEVGFVSLVAGLNLDYLSKQPFHHTSAGTDIFQNSMIAVSSPSRSHKDAETIGVKIARSLGAEAIFMDAAEVQAACTRTMLIPRLAAAALTNLLADQPNWREDRLLASSDFYLFTEPLMGVFDLEHPSLPFSENRDSMLMGLDLFQEEMDNLRALLAAEDSEPLEEYLHRAMTSRAVWQDQRARNSFKDADTHDKMPTTREVYSQLLFGGLSRRQREQDE
ncbi:MAG TPA: prephenate dehydrogenase/arogenate dehydrogenase family protein [Chloroflexi bacterium]|nr:prephenate dehydrogenase/arogenate dehydrogenase family protein [Chloroflexota bacterium]